MSIIRRATAADASSLAALSIEVWLSTYIREGVNAFFANYALETFTAQKLEQQLADPQVDILASQNKVGIDGYIAIAAGAAPPVAGVSDLEIARLYVQPRHQSGRIGKALLEAGLKLAAEKGRPDVWLAVNAENPRAAAFYLREGFEPCGETRFAIGEERYLNQVLRYRF